MCKTIDKTMQRKIISCNPRLKQRARELRNSATRAEVVLWEYLKGKQMLAYDFHRQKPLDEYIVDFFCSEFCLAVEIDGSGHADRTEEDRHRQSRLESLGVNFLRYLDSDVKNNVEGVVASIRVWIEEHTPAFGHPSQEGIGKSQSSKSPPKGGSTTAQSSGFHVKAGSTTGQSSKSRSQEGNKKDAVCVPVLDDNMEVSDPCKEKREYHNGQSSKSPLERGFRGV